MDKVAILEAMAPVFAGLGFMGIIGWVITTWLRVKHGYPLETSWGKAVHPVVTTETTERLRLLATDNAQLRAEVASLKDRTAVLERIATDQSAQLDRQIESLRDTKIN